MEGALRGRAAYRRGSRADPLQNHGGVGSHGRECYCRMTQRSWCFEAGSSTGRYDLRWYARGGHRPCARRRGRKRQVCGVMKKTKAAISFGLEIIEDTDTGELSLQCLCGQMALYPRRVVLTPDETARFNAGSF